MNRAFSAAFWACYLPGALPQAAINVAPLALNTYAGASGRRSAPFLPSFDRHGISRFVFRYKRFTKLIECSLFNFGARLIH
jgi:hypothetical protein